MGNKQKSSKLFMHAPTTPELNELDATIQPMNSDDYASGSIRQPTNCNSLRTAAWTDFGEEASHVDHFVHTFLAASFAVEVSDDVGEAIVRKDKATIDLDYETMLILAHKILEASGISTEDPSIEMLLGDHATNGTTREQEPNGSVDPMEYEHGIASLVQTIESLYSEELVAISRDAKCIDADPEAFFPEKGGSTKEAKKICDKCPVRKPCLDYAMEHNERFGIWGGLSERERRRRKQQEGDIQPKTPATADAV